MFHKSFAALASLFHNELPFILFFVPEVQIEGWMGTREKQFNLIGVVNWDCFEARSTADHFYFGDLGHDTRTEEPQLDEQFQASTPHHFLLSSNLKFKKLSKFDFSEFFFENRKILERLDFVAATDVFFALEFY